MAHKTSHSQNNDYIACPQYWSHKYQGGWRSMTEGSSLYFGTAIDTAATEMLLGNKNYLDKFHEKWDSQTNDGKVIQIFDNTAITFAHKDFDSEVLEAGDFKDLEAWAKQLNLMPAASTPTNLELVQLFRDASKAKGSPYLKFTDDQFKYFNRCCWLSLKRKGKIMLKALEEQFLPKVKKVLATQKRSKVEDAVTGDQVVGYIDMIVELEGYDKPVILDLKTSSFPYDQSQLDLSPQLTIYAAMEAKNYNTDLVGYVILNKNIPKLETAYCKTCGYKRLTRHKTCDNLMPNGDRCHGDWLESKIPNLQVQVMIDKKSQDKINSQLLDAGAIIQAMKLGIVYKNTSKCEDWYGGKCGYFNLCHKNDSSGLTKRK
jgi:PD-(D/E)XK nuclease superfamily